MTNTFITCLFAAAAFAAPAADTAPAPEPAHKGVPIIVSEPGRHHHRHGQREIVQFGKSFTVAEGETVDSVVVIGASVDVRGTVNQDVVAVGGGVGVTGSVGKDVVAVGGALDLGPNAVVGGDAVAVGGGLNQEPGSQVQGSRNSFSVPLVVPSMGWLHDWLSSGLLMGRPLPHRASWAWALSGAMLLVYLLVGAAFPGPVERCAEALLQRPATALGVGALALAMAGPAALLLVISVVGIAAVPLALCAAAAGVLVGKAAVYRVVGGRLGVPVALGALLAGAVVFTLLYAVPGVGFVAWGASFVFGAGAALLAVAEQFRGERAPAAAAAAAAPVTAPAPEPAPAPAEKPAASLPRAGFMPRLGAFAVDVFAFVVLTGFLPLIHANLAAWAVYQVGMWTWKGTTLGGIVCGVKGVRVNGEPMDLRVAVVRHLASYLSLAAGTLGFLWAAWDPEGQTWHDKLAGTFVVAVPKGQALL